MRCVRREITHICWFLVKKTKQLLPLFMVVGIFIFILRDQGSTTQTIFDRIRVPASKGHNSSFLHHGKPTESQQKSTAKPYDKYAMYSVRGERNAARTKDVCTKFHTHSQDISLTVRLSKGNNLLFCPIYKVGTTFWRRVFMIQREKKYSNFANPYSLPFDKDYPASRFTWRKNKTVSQYKVMFTRDPYNRLFSFYIDKILAPNPYFWKSVGVEVAAFTRKIPKSKLKLLCGHDITFSEFIKYVIHTLETRQKIDPHWIELEENCHSCEIKYDFIGQMENFNEDSMHVLQKLGLTNMATFLEKHGKDASVDDAIRDTLSQPFTFRVKYRRCVGFKEALARAWHKLQTRGLIGNTTLEVRSIQENTIKLQDVLWRALVARNASTAAERTEIKNKRFKELWKQVNVTDLFNLKKLYVRDFELFGYDSMPSTLFQSNIVT